MEPLVVAEEKADHAEKITQALVVNENGDSTQKTTDSNDNNLTSGVDKTQDKLEGSEVNKMTKALIAICSGDRQKKKAFMSVPRIKDVIEKAHSYGLNGTKIVLENNGCEICEDEVLDCCSKDKLLLMLLDENEKYIMPTYSTPTISAITRNKLSNSSSVKLQNADDSQLSNTESDLTFSNDETLSKTAAKAAAAKSNTEFADFKIPWYKIPSEIMELFRTKRNLDKHLNTFANILIDELRERSLNVPSSVIRNVAHQAALKYPQSLIEKDRDGQLMSSTPNMLITKMLNRYSFLNRAPKRNANNSNSFEIVIQTKKRKSNIAFASNVGVDSASRTDMEKKKNKLIAFHKSGKGVHDDVIHNLMKETYPLQRAFFNNSEEIADIDSIKRNWPYIFSMDVIFQHFQSLMGMDPLDFQKTFDLEKKNIFEFFKNSKNKKINGLELTDMNIFRGLAYYFDEDPDYMFKFYEYGTTIEVLENENPTNAPWIGFVKETSTSNEYDSKAHYFIEGKRVATHLIAENHFAETIVELICYFYTFNMMYPKEVTQTWEFLVIYFLKHYPKVEQRANKKTTNAISKYNQLIAKITKQNC